MTQGFDEYWNKENVRFDDSYHKHKETYDLGAASRQAEIDELKKRIDDAMKYISNGCGGSLDPITKLGMILKGESNE